MVTIELGKLIDTLPADMQPQAAPGTWEVALRKVGTGGSLLNAGAGRGGLSHILRRSGFNVTSVDLHPDHFMAEGMTCQGVDLTQPLPYPDASFDTVLAVEVAEHLENPWLFMREAVRVLKPAGVLVFTSPNIVNLVSRIKFLRSGLLPYFREESFVGCYHVTPIFPWSVERWCTTASAEMQPITYSRVDWPTSKDIPRFYAGGKIRALKDLIPLNSLTGEISCYQIKKSGSAQREVGLHYS